MGLLRGLQSQCGWWEGRWRSPGPTWHRGPAFLFMRPGFLFSLGDNVIEGGEQVGHRPHLEIPLVFPSVGENSLLPMNR